MWDSRARERSEDLNATTRCQPRTLLRLESLCLYLFLILIFLANQFLFARSFSSLDTAGFQTLYCRYSSPVRATLRVIDRRAIFVGRNADTGCNQDRESEKYHSAIYADGKYRKRTSRRRGDVYLLFASNVHSKKFFADLVKILNITVRITISCICY